MSSAGRLIAFVDAALLLLALAGLILRRRIAASPLFAAYLLTSIPLVLAVPLWPELHTWGFFLGSALAQTGLRLMLAVELSSHIFARLPRARRRAAWMLAAATVVTLAVVARMMAAPADHPFYEAWRVLEHVTFASGCMLASVLGLAWWHAVPVDRLHREIGGGLLVWSLAHALEAQLVALDQLLALGPFALGRLIYVGVLVAWAVEGWRHEEHCPRDLVPLLRPWRAA